MDCNSLCSIIFKYGGYWTSVKGQSRMKYVGGSQKTLNFEREQINLLLLKEQIESLCRWIRGHAYDLHYHCNGTSPKFYLPIRSDADVMDMVTGSYNGNRMEVVVAVKEVQEDMGQYGNMEDVTVNTSLNNDVIVDDLCDGSLAAQVEELHIVCVGSRYDDSLSFKQAIRSKAILENFAIKIKASDKSRVIATCAYRGCPWRIRAWTAANCYSMHVFNTKLQEIFRISPDVYSYLSAMTCKWSKATFSKHIKNHNNTNNMSESFNSWVAEARNKPVVDLIDMIRGMMMEQRSQRKLNSYSWKGPLVPFVEDYIREITTRKDSFIIRQSTSTIAEVESSFERHEVDIDNHLCSCGFWELSGLPCVHAAAFVGTNHHTIWHTYVNDSYHVNMYRMAYDGAISTLPGKEQWSIPIDDSFVCPPITIRPRGRPKKRRFKNFLEGANKSKRSHKCGRCNSWGHHRSTCKEPITYEGDDIQTGFASKLPIRRSNYNSDLD